MAPLPVVVPTPIRLPEAAAAAIVESSAVVAAPAAAPAAAAATAVASSSSVSVAPVARVGLQSSLEETTHSEEADAEAEDETTSDDAEEASARPRKRRKAGPSSGLLWAEDEAPQSLFLSDDADGAAAPPQPVRPSLHADSRKSKRVANRKTYEPVIDQATEISIVTYKAWLADASDITGRSPPAALNFNERRLRAARAFMCEGLAPGSSAYTAAYNLANAGDYPASGVGCMGPKLRALMRANFTSAVRLKHLPYCKPTDQEIATTNDGMEQTAVDVLDSWTRTEDQAEENKEEKKDEDAAASEEWPPRLYFAKPLAHLLPLHPLVQQHLRASPHAVIVIPCSEDQSTFRIDLAARGAHKYADQQVALMSLSTCSVGPLRTPAELNAAKAAAAAAATRSSLYPPILTADLDAIQTFLDADWAALMRSGSKQRPVAPETLRDRLYCKNVSEKECSSGSGTRPRGGFFPQHWKTLEDILQSSQPESGHEEKDGAIASAKRLAWLAQHFQRLDELKKNKPGAAAFFTHALHMDELQLHRESLSLLSALRLDGAEGYYLYEKIGFQFFNLHIEQMLFTFIHHQLEGESLWFLIPFGQLDKLYALAADVYAVSHPLQSRAHCLVMGRAQLLAKEFFFPRSVLRAKGIECHQMTLKAGEVLIAHGGFAHFGYSTHPGSTLSVSTNVVTDDWLEQGLPFLLQHFQWVTRLAKEVLPAAAAAAAAARPADDARLSVEEDTLLRLANEAINMCPCTFVCSFLRGLLAEADSALAGRPTLCTYSITRDRARWATIRQQCLDVLTLIHGDARESIQRVVDQYYRHDPKEDKPQAVCHASCKAPPAADGSASMELD